MCTGSTTGQRGCLRLGAQTAPPSIPSNVGSVMRARRVGPAASERWRAPVRRRLPPRPRNQRSDTALTSRGCPRRRRRENSRCPLTACPAGELDAERGPLTQFATDGDRASVCFDDCTRDVEALGRCRESADRGARRERNARTAPRSSDAMPIPVSLTSSRTIPFTGVSETRTLPPAGVNFSAFETRLSMSWNIRPVSLHSGNAPASQVRSTPPRGTAGRPCDRLPYHARGPAPWMEIELPGLGRATNSKSFTSEAGRSALRRRSRDTQLPSVSCRRRVSSSAMTNQRRPEVVGMSATKFILDPTASSSCRSATPADGGQTPTPRARPFRPPETVE